MKLEQSMYIEESTMINSGENRLTTYDRIVSEAIDNALSSLGNLCKQAIYSNLECAFNLQRSEIPARVQDFAHALEQIFGVGAGLIEIEIMKNLRSKAPQFKHSPEQECLSFETYVLSLKRFV